MYEERLTKRREFLKRSLEDYDEMIERTGLFSSSIDVRTKFNFTHSFYPPIKLESNVRGYEIERSRNLSR